MSVSRTPEQQVLDALHLTPEEQDWIEHHRYTRMPPKGEEMPNNSLETLTTEELLAMRDKQCHVGNNVWSEIRRRLDQLGKCETAATALLDGMDTCHMCQVKVHVGEDPTHCIDCTADCEAHEGPDCKPLSLLHQELRAALEGK